jgi:hypothetical protein
MTSLNSRPPVNPLDLVNTEALVTISISNGCINIVVVKNPSQARIVVDTLTTRSVNSPMRRQNKGTATVGTAHTTLIYESTGSRVGSADLDLVFLTSGRAVLVQIAAATFAEEHVIATVVVDHVCTFAVVGTGRFEDGIVGTSGVWVDGVGGGVHLDLVDIVPEGAKVHEVLVSNLDEVGIDGVVRFAAVGGDTSCRLLLVILLLSTTNK